MTENDLELLRHFARDHAQDAFTALVSRQVNLVYSAALRQVRSPQLAEEVTQSVFTDLARNAGKLADATGDTPVLTAWLYTVTRRTAVDLIRKESRRQLREEIAHQMNAINATDPDWMQIGPHLDEAMATLDDTDRTALLLRYFQNKSFREVGQQLGVSDDTAQKRVSRAVERLRELMAQRGVTVGTGALAVIISANAVQAAPAGLAASIATTTFVGTAVSTVTLIAATKTIAMTTLQKALVTTALTVLAGAGIFEACQASRLREQNQILQQQQAGQIQQLQHERDDALNRLAGFSKTAGPHLPAPLMQITNLASAAPVEDSPSTNLYARFNQKTPLLTAAQVEAYLKTRGRNASSLLATYRTSHDPALLREAMEKFPDAPQVAFEAAVSKDLSEAEKQQWVTAFKKADPGNSLPNYLSALNHFDSGQIDQGIQELTAAAGKPLNDYTLNRTQDDNEAYLSAGYSVAEAETISSQGLILAQLAPLKQLGLHMVDLANSYAQAGDQTSAQEVLKLTMNLGQTLQGSSSNPVLISQLVGMAVQRMALGAMDPASPYGDNGQTVQDQLNQLAQNRQVIRDLFQQAEPLMPQMSDQDWVTYSNRRMLFGEVAAAQWLVGKYGQK